MELIKTKKEIELTINQLKKAKKKLKIGAETKAKTIAEYEKSLAIMIIKLKNDAIDSFEGEIIAKNLPANLIEKIAKGICYQEKLNMEEAEAKYKALLAYIEAIKAELNGYQSIYRHLD
jgi:hypothetical protein